jgi:hypothetical protein
MLLAPSGEAVLVDYEGGGPWASAGPLGLGAGQSEEPAFLVDDAQRGCHRGDVPGQGLGPHGLQQGFETIQLGAAVSVDGLASLAVQGLVNDAVHGAAVGVSEALGDGLVAVAGGGEFDGSGSSPCGEGGVAVPTNERDWGLGGGHARHGSMVAGCGPGVVAFMWPAVG